MENVFAAIVAVALILLAGLTLFGTSLSTQEEIIASWAEMSSRTNEQDITFLTPITATTKSAGTIVEVTLRNNGSTRLAEYNRWDLMLQYYTESNTLKVDWYPYVDTTPGNNQWTVSGIYMDAATAKSEVFEPGILNPGEEIVLQVQLQPSVGLTTTNMLTLSANNGFSTSTFFER